MSSVITCSSPIFNHFPHSFSRNRKILFAEVVIYYAPSIQMFIVYFQSKYVSFSPSVLYLYSKLTSLMPRGWEHFSAIPFSSSSSFAVAPLPSGVRRGAGRVRQQDRAVHRRPLPHVRRLARRRGGEARGSHGATGHQRGALDLARLPASAGPTRFALFARPRGEVHVRVIVQGADQEHVSDRLFHRHHLRGASGQNVEPHCGKGLCFFKGFTPSTACYMRIARGYLKILYLLLNEKGWKLQDKVTRLLGFQKLERI